MIFYNKYFPIKESGRIQISKISKWGGSEERWESQFFSFYRPEIGGNFPSEQHKINGFLKQDVRKQKNVSGWMHKTLLRQHDILQKKPVPL